MIEWINVQDKLPDLLTPVLIFDNGSSKDLIFESNAATPYRFGFTYETAFHGVKWMIECRYTGSTYIKKEVTHWMPLPQLPNVEILGETL